MLSIRSLPLATLLGSSLLVCGPVVEAIELRALGHLPDKPASYPSAISADGSTVVGASITEGAPEIGVPDRQTGFRWTEAEGMQSLGSIIPEAVSPDGSVVVGAWVEPFDRYKAPSPPSAVRWSSGDVHHLEGLTDVAGISADGAVLAVSSGILFDQSAFRWTDQGGLQDLGDLPGGRDFSMATGMSAAGDVVVGISDSEKEENVEAFIWTPDGGMEDLGSLLNVDTTWPTAVSGDGTTVVGFSSDDAIQLPFRWTRQDGITPLRALTPGMQGAATDISADGSLIVGGGGGRALLWRGDTVYDLNAFLPVAGASGWVLRSADAISADGNAIAGSAINPNGEAEPFLLTGVSGYLDQISSECESSTWAEWLVEEGCWTDTGPEFLGWIYTGISDWAYWSSADKWLYLPEEQVTDQGAWIYVVR